MTLPFYNLYHSIVCVVLNLIPSMAIICFFMLNISFQKILSSYDSPLLSIDLLAATHEYRTPPENINSSDNHLFSHEYHKYIKPCRAQKLSNLDIIGSYWFRLPSPYPQDRYQPFNGRKNTLKDCIRSLPHIVDKPLFIECALWIHDNWSGGYFHWLTEIIPKLIAWRKANYNHLPVLLPEQFRNLPFISETLDHFRFTYIYFSSSQRLHVNELWIIDSISASGNYRSDLIRDLVAHIKACLNIPKQPSSFNELKNIILVERMLTVVSS